MKRTSPQTGSRLIRWNMKRMWVSTINWSMNMKGNSKVHKWVGYGMLKMSKTTKGSILILTPILSHSPTIMALRYGRWFTRITVSLGQGEVHIATMAKTYASNKSSSTRWSLAFILAFRPTYRDSTKTRQLKPKCGPTSKYQINSLPTMSCTTNAFSTTQTALKTSCSSIKFTSEPSNKSHLTWWRTTQFTLRIKWMTIVQLCC